MRTATLTKASFSSVVERHSSRFSRPAMASSALRTRFSTTCWIWILSIITGRWASSLVLTVTPRSDAPTRASAIASSTTLLTSSRARWSSRFSTKSRRRRMM